MIPSPAMGYAKRKPLTGNPYERFDEEGMAARPSLYSTSMSHGGTGSGQSQPYGEHSVTALGYSDYDEDYVFIHDTWDEQTHTIAFGNWWAAMATWVRP